MTVSESCRSINIVPDKLRDTIFGGRGEGSVRTAGHQGLRQDREDALPVSFRLSQEGLLAAARASAC